MLKQLLSVFLQSRCPCCQRNTPDTLCSYCLQKLISHEFTTSDRRYWQGDLPVFAWGKYDGQLKRAIALMKYHQQPDLGRILGQLLAQAWLVSGLIKPQQQVSVIPIPLYSQKFKDRGFNQAEIIAQSFCQVTGYRLDSQALMRVRDTKAMFDLSPEARINNLQGAFQLGQKLPKYPVLLLDDIYTLGTTVKEAARTLRQQQIKVIGVVVVAKTS
ncbi:MAG: ComF family protein [Waterburya sp.]